MTEPIQESGGTPWFGEDPGGDVAASEPYPRDGATPYLILCMLLAFGAAEVAKAGGSSSMVIVWPLAAVALLLLMLLVGSFTRVRQVFRLPRQPPVARYDKYQDPLPVDVRAFLGACHRGFERLGFEFVDAVVVTNWPRGARSLTGLYVNRTTREVAQANVLLMQTETQQLRSMYLEFGSDFTDGAAVATTNCGNPESAFPSVSEPRSTHASDVRDVAVLYRLHQFICEKHCPLGTSVLNVDGQYQGNGLAWFESEFTRPFDRQVAVGNLSRDERQYSTTTKGTFVCGWFYWYPVLLLRRWRNAAKARRLVREALATAE